MSIAGEEQEKTVMETITQRTWRFTVFSEKAPYSCCIHRETVTAQDDTIVGAGRIGVAPVVGEPAAGTLGDQPSDYTSAVVGFSPAVRVDVAALAGTADTVTVPSIDGGEITVRLADLPAILAAACDRLASRHDESLLAAAVLREVAKVSE